MGATSAAKTGADNVAQTDNVRMVNFTERLCPLAKFLSPVPKLARDSSTDCRCPNRSAKLRSASTPNRRPIVVHSTT